MSAVAGASDGVVVAAAVGYVVAALNGDGHPPVVGGAGVENDCTQCRAVVPIH